MTKHNVNYFLIWTKNLIQKTTCQSYLRSKKNESYDVKTDKTNGLLSQIYMFDQ